MIISFSGLDGTGKTTQARLTAEFLSKRGVKCRIRHAVRDSFYYFLVHSIVGRVSGEAKDAMEGGLRGGKGAASRFFLSMMKKKFLLIDAAYFTLRYSWYKGRKDRAIICDRYYYDELAQARYLGLAGRLFTFIYKAFIVKPDIAFLLTAAPDVAKGRKDEYEKSYFEKKEKIFGELKNEFGLIEIPSEGIESTQGRIEDRIAQVPVPDRNNT